MEPISIENLIKILQERKINLGKGDPYNRLRYYTKIGWLPHMIRKKNQDGVISGHYPMEVIDKIIEIEKLKKEGLDNIQITNYLKKENNKPSLVQLIIKSLKKINPTFILISLIVFSVIIESVRIISHNENNEPSIPTEVVSILPERKIIDSGVGFISEGQSKIFIPSSKVTPTSIILLNFFSNIGYNNNHFVGEIKSGQGFYIETYYQVPKEAKFNWALIQ